MKRWIRIAAIAALALVAGQAHAQAPKGNLPPHQASLSWTAGTGTTGSNAYRCPGTCTATTGTFTVLNSAPLTTTTYVDQSVVANTTYSYCVTGTVTLSTGPFETACSNVFTATIPKDAASPPTGLAGTVQ